MNRQMMKGNEAIAEAAVQAGCRYYFGYPITPQSEIPEYMSKRLPEVGGAFLQAESEIAAINMVYGAAGAGARAMTSSSSPGMSLQAGGHQLHRRRANCPAWWSTSCAAARAWAASSPPSRDYYQATRGGGHGDYRMIVLAPASVQEAADLTMKAFDVADKYRMPAMILGDGTIGQMMEPVSMPEIQSPRSCRQDAGPPPAGTRACSRERAHHQLPVHRARRAAKQQAAHAGSAIQGHRRERDAWSRAAVMDDAEYVVVAYGTTARIANTAVRNARASRA